MLCRPFDIRDRSYLFAREVIVLCRKVSAERDFVMRRLIGQLVDSAGSVGANLEEADDGQTKPDFISKTSIALKEVRSEVLVAAAKRCRPASLPGGEPIDRRSRATEKNPQDDHHQSKEEARSRPKGNLKPECCPLFLDRNNKSQPARKRAGSCSPSPTYPLLEPNPRRQNERPSPIHALTRARIVGV